MSLAVDGCFGGQFNKVICKNYFTDIQSSESFSFYGKILSQLATISNKKYDILTILQNLIIYYYLSRKSVSAVTYLILLAQLIFLSLIALALNITQISSCHFFNYLIQTLKLFYVGSRFYFCLSTTGSLLYLVIQH